MKNKPLLLILFVFGSINIYATSVEDGKAIFSTRCASCHTVNTQLVGPALADVDKRHSGEWLASFIQSPKSMIEKKDNEALALFNQFNQVMMPDHQDISASDVSNILAYIKSETKTGIANDAPFAKPGKIVPGYHPFSFDKNYGFFIVYLVAVLLLVLLLLFAVNIKDIQRKAQQH